MTPSTKRLAVCLAAAGAGFVAAVRQSIVDTDEALELEHVAEEAAENRTLGSSPRFGLEVELADGRINRFIQAGGKRVSQGDYSHKCCMSALQYGAGWFESSERCGDSDWEADWGAASLPLLAVESEVFERDTLEMVSGPSTNPMQAIQWIASLSQAMMNQHFTVGDLITLASSVTGLDMQVANALASAGQTCSDETTDCTQKLWVKTANKDLIAGIQVNFEMKLAQVHKLSDPHMMWFGTGGHDDWMSAKECLGSLWDSADFRSAAMTVSGDAGLVKNALLIALHQSAVVSTCRQSGACKKGQSMLPKVAIDPAMRLSIEGRTTLFDITGLTWEGLREYMRGNAKCKMPANARTRPDDRMFSTPPLGFAGSPSDPILVMEARSGSAGIARDAKTYFQCSVRGKSSRVQSALTGAFGNVARWAFTDFSNVKLEATAQPSCS